MRGRWLPRAGLDKSRALIVLTGGPILRVFRMVKLQLLATDCGPGRGPATPPRVRTEINQRTFKVVRLELTKAL